MPSSTSSKAVHIVFPNEDTTFVKKENKIKGYGQILQFLEKYVKSDHSNEVDFMTTLTMFRFYEITFVKNQNINENFYPTYITVSGELLGNNR